MEISELCVRRAEALGRWQIVVWHILGLNKLHESGDCIGRIIVDGDANFGTGRLDVKKW